MSEECFGLPTRTDQVSDISCAQTGTGSSLTVFGVRARLKLSLHKHEEILTQQKESPPIIIQVICTVFPQQKYKDLAKLTNNTHHARDIRTPPLQQEEMKARESMCLV